MKSAAAALVLLSAFAAGEDGPVEFGRARLVAALGGATVAVDVVTDSNRAPESFAIAPHGAGAQITAADPAGAMYGLLELAERARRDGARGVTTAKVDAKPFLRDRGLNVFLTLPWDYEKNDTDYDPAALADPQRWWFQNEDYWTTLLDLMAESRLNWLDLHGTWDVSVTDAPNLYAYFVQSETFPEVGVSPELKAKNLERLNWVIERAHARGVRVSLMAYEARLSTPHRRSTPYPTDEATAYAYTRDVVERMIRGAPALDAIGFRIGESGRGGEFFRCYEEAVANSGRDIPLLTRSWVTRKEKVVPLARASSDFTVEIKYDGEQWAAPYPFAGGRVANWHSYSFEDYLSDSSAMAPEGAPAPKKLWPGNPIVGASSPDGEKARWPDQPYKIVWQVRANGTHRIFPFFEPSWVRRSIEPMKIGTASGFTIEPENAYYPASPRYYVADAAAVPCDWIHQRDELYLMQWGRLGYDPKTPDSVFEQRLKERFGAAAERLSKAWRAASRIVPLALLAHAYGPDHRDHAPEFEWGGGTREWIEGEGLDTHVFLPIREEMALKATGGSDGRRSAHDVAIELESLANTATEQLSPMPATGLDDSSELRLAELRHAISQLAALGRYHAFRHLSAWNAALAEAAPGTPGAAEDAIDWMADSLEAWRNLATGPDAAFYKPFTERLRMRTNAFSWRDQLPKVEEEHAKIKSLGVVAPKATRANTGAGGRGHFDLDGPPPDPKLEWTGRGDQIVASLPSQGIERAWLLSKPLPSSTFFHRVPMTKETGQFAARIPRERWGHLLAAEFQRSGRNERVRRIPDALAETPWLVVPSTPGPTPLIYSTEEALAHLDPASLDPAKHGPIVIAPRAWHFSRAFDVPTQRKLLDAVERGMTLLVLQQDWTSGRYPMGWLLDPPKVENFRSEVFDPAGVLRLELTRAPDLITQRLVASTTPPASPTSPKWLVHGNGGIASGRYGKGEIWLVQARLIQNLHLPGCARTLLRLLGIGGGEKPVVLVDPGTEGSRYATSVLPDFMNAHGLAFLTLGEVVAKEQGVAGIPVVPARPWDDLVLGGKGPAEQQAFLDKQARASAAGPLPTSREAFESQRPARLQLVRRCLGLDPLPPRTPLNLRTTGVLERDGYRIEKLVFESRPGFFVTAHLYVPTSARPAANGKFPVIVHGHGHWQHKKNEPTLQQIQIQQALRGYLALIVDTPGHSFEGDAKIERRFQGSHSDFRNLLGSMNTTAVYVWDLMRALDWLETRPDADMSRVGITGASGGGLATLWAFAAEERFACAVPVCFATSFEDEPHNGCPCNHVPGTLKLGDRAEALAVRAPAPVLVLGADDDREFPPAGTKRTGEKLQAIWSLFDDGDPGRGAKDKAGWKVFRSQHDYNLEMCATALGFFDLHLKGEGDGSPPVLTARPTEPQDSPELFCLPEPPANPVTMRDLAVAKLAAATAQPRAADANAAAATSLAEFIALNGGATAGSATNVVVRDEHGRESTLPKSPNDVKARGAEKLFVVFESEPGLRIPGILWLPAGAPRGAVVLVSDSGKARAPLEFGIEKLLLGGFACFAIDPRGFGELAGIDVRLLVYRGTSPAFAAAVDVNRAIELLRPLCPKVGVVAEGPAASLAALSAALITPDLAAVIGRHSMREFGDAFAEEVPLLALQPQADLLAPLSKIRASVSVPAHWTFQGDGGFDLFAALLRLMKL